MDKMVKGPLEEAMVPRTVKSETTATGDIWATVSAAQLHGAPPRRPSRFHRRLGLIFALICLGLVVILLRLIHMQIVMHQYYFRRAQFHSRNVFFRPAPRGRILDRDGAVLAFDKDVFDISVSPRELRAEQEELARALSRTCNLRRSDLLQRFQDLESEVMDGGSREDFPIAVADGISARAVEKLRTRMPPLVGVTISEGRSFSLAVAYAHAFPSRRRVIGNLALLLRRSPSEVARALTSLEADAGAEYVVRPFVRNVDFDTIARIETNPQAFPGVYVTTRYSREYPDGSLASHVLGYVSPPSDHRRFLEEQGVPEKYGRGWVRFPIPLVGRAGAEAQLDGRLRGEPGSEYVEVDVLNRVRRRLGEFPPKPGEDIRLTIRVAIQRAAEEALREALAAVRPPAGKKPAGVAIVMDPWNGEILAMASSPAFNPNDLVPPVGQATVDALFGAGSGAPMLCRATAGLYPAGSVFKIVTAAAALEEGIIGPGSKHPTFNCLGAFVPPGLSLEQQRQRAESATKLRCWEAHGHVASRAAIENSCNVFFFDAAYYLGQEKLCAWAAAFGFGRETGIELPSAKAGSLPTPYWKAVSRRGPWEVTDTLNLAVGQGDLLVTPMDIARMIAAIANGGKLLRPRLVSAENPGSEGSVVPMKPANLELIRAGLADVVDRGTAAGSGLEEFRAAGKTGSAEVAEGILTHAWFAGYAPRENPRFVVTVLLEHGGAGGTVAAPVAAGILRRMATEDDDSG